MLCQSCGKNQATTHVKSIVNGELREYMLCPECAKKMGYGSLFDGVWIQPRKLLRKLFGRGDAIRTYQYCTVQRMWFFF